MATRHPESSAQARVAQHLLGTLNDAFALAQRYREAEGFRRYVRDRLQLVVPALALILLTGFACAMAAVLLFIGPRPLAALAGLLLAPVLLAGSLFVQLYVFFAWLEERALARSLGHRTGPAPGKIRRVDLSARLGADLGPPACACPGCWRPIFVFLPLAVLTQVAPKSRGAAHRACWRLAPILYARFDQLSGLPPGRACEPAPHSWPCSPPCMPRR